MKKFCKYLFSFFLLISVSFMFTGCLGEDAENLPISKWFTIKESEGFIYSEQNNKDSLVDLESRGLTAEKMSDDDEWNTPLVRYSTIYLKPKTEFKLLGLAFEVKSTIDEVFSIEVELQVYQELSFPSNWDELTEEAKMIWEKENRIKLRSVQTSSVSKKNANCLSFGIEYDIKSNMHIRLKFNNIEKDVNILNNFQCDNFIVMIEN